MDLNTKKLFSREFEQRLQTLTDLSPKDVQALYEISEVLPLTVHPSTRNSLKRDNFIVNDGTGFKLTSLGKVVYQRVLDILNDDWDPGRYLDADQINLLKGKAPVSVASRIRKYLGVDVGREQRRKAGDLPWIRTTILSSAFEMLGCGFSQQRLGWHCQ